MEILQRGRIALKKCMKKLSFVVLALSICMFLLCQLHAFASLYSFPASRDYYYCSAYEVWKGMLTCQSREFLPATEAICSGTKVHLMSPDRRRRKDKEINFKERYLMKTGDLGNISSRLTEYKYRSRGSDCVLKLGENYDKVESSCIRTVSVNCRRKLRVWADNPDNPDPNVFSFKFAVPRKK